MQTNETKEILLLLEPGKEVYAFNIHSKWRLSVKAHICMSRTRLRHVFDSNK
jgi:hypothetical protein